MHHIKRRETSEKEFGNGVLELEEILSESIRGGI